ncbi:MAG: PepSY-associated TM helix domain-containing protein [Sulfurimonas sp.]|jgi:sulfite reductase (NADPH) flavoprotein alpha-component|nr:PepSY-associated TM helix domain-containing protein [Sulfurimonas sp.]MDD3835332.1 PepSY-associated TM helix domain-containing protein [Sulfurimonas sp.]
MLKKTILKLHLYLGLVASLILIIVAISGALLSYEKELLRIFNSDSFYVKPQEKLLPLGEIIEKFQVQKLRAKITSISLAGELDSSYTIRVASKTNRKGDSLYINPYTAEILPEVNGAEFFKFIEDLHRRLTFGEIGKQIVGASTIILIVLLLSGIYMYMPKMKRGFINSLKVNKKAKGIGFLSSLHSAIGIWIIPLYLTVSLTGLYWSYTWYRGALFTLTGVEKPQRSFKKGEQKRLSIEPKEVENVFEKFHHEIKEYQYLMMFMPHNTKEYRFSYVDKNPSHVYARNSLTIDASSMNITQHERYDDKTVGGKFMASMLALHSGEYFGFVGQFLMFLASLAMPLFGITGLMLYLKKKEKKVR